MPTIATSRSMAERLLNDIEMIRAVETDVRREHAKRAARMCALGVVQRFATDWRAKDHLHDNIYIVEHAPRKTELEHIIPINECVGKAFDLAKSRIGHERRILLLADDLEEFAGIRVCVSKAMAATINNGKLNYTGSRYTMPEGWERGSCPSVRYQQVVESIIIRRLRRDMKKVRPQWYR